MIINVLGINGSPRLGNSQYLLDHALENASEVDRENVKIDTYSMKGKTMNPCIACSHCVKHHGDCVHVFRHFRFKSSEHTVTQPIYKALQLSRYTHM
ncbi:MAG TPA: flavodoxin family protein, partial [Spirochaetes bacterium]|nr:flavodoxin family protein [Spirochaetota bacterium]